MRKIYQAPSTEVIKMNTFMMIAASNPEGFNSELDSEGGDGSNALGRCNFSPWDEDDEE